MQSMWDGHLARIGIAKHRIKLLEESTQPAHSNPYRARPKTRDFENVEFEKMLSQKILKLTCTELAAPVAFARKKDGTLRFCVEYLRLNGITKRDRIQYYR